ncbi:hypothetical protein AB8Z38_16505 [Bradyrhizobium sp. LLZ17]|uniref:Uncharacterized protein n=1 Tax=Bradyrhizobium sp. LLZ17 TaxID=3239388 RepID=A0AB39XS41_9BRAD
MLTLLGARSAAVFSARGRYFRFIWPLLVAFGLAGCMPAAVPLASGGPADPAARVAPVGYRSTIAPYTSLRPTTPAPWRERNDSVAPPPKQDQ